MGHPGHDPREKQEDDDEKKKQEQEAKLKKILKDNELLQKDIAEKDRKIDLLRRHLALRRQREEEEARETEKLARDAAMQSSNGTMETVARCEDPKISEERLDRAGSPAH